MNADHGPLGPPACIAGVLRYDGERAARGYRITRFLVWISQPENREGFLADEGGAMDRFALDDSERALVVARDYTGLLNAGASIYAVAKSGHVFGASLVSIGASMRGQSAAEFLAWRRARNAAEGT